MKNRVIEKYGDPDNIHDLLTYCRQYMEEVAFRGEIEVKLLAVSLMYSTLVSNSHSCPIGGQQNWDRRKHPERPTGYPGWYGRIWIIKSKAPTRIIYNDGWNQVYLHTGTGGYGYYNNPYVPVKDLNRYRDNFYPTSYDVTVWESDWPKFREGILFEEQKDKVESSITGIPTKIDKLINHAIGSIVDEFRSSEANKQSKDSVVY